MTLHNNVMAHAVACALSAFAIQALAQQQTNSLAPVVVTADPFSSDDNAMILTPSKVLAGDELHDKLGGSLGETLSKELGVSTSGFSAGSSRPVIRGLDGARVKILQNGMSTSDLSSISSDHAVGSAISTARQVEILRGPAALMYGSGAIGGLVNIVNDRIPTVLEKKFTGESELRLSSVDHGTALHASGDGAVGTMGLHVDAGVLNAGDYRVPATNTPLSFTGNHENTLGFGASSIKEWGFVGASISQLNKLYGIHGRDEKSKIDMSQTRIDVDSLVKTPFDGIESMRIKLAHSDYQHTELENGSNPTIRFDSHSTESRWELAHTPMAGWRGKLGLQTEATAVQTMMSDPSQLPTVPHTRSTSNAAFIVEEQEFGKVRLNLGARVEGAARNPVTGSSRYFQLRSYSAGALWSFVPGYGLGFTASVAERAPTAEELYSHGPHHPTETFDVGNPELKKEVSNNFDLSLQKNAEKLRWKLNVFQNKIKNFVYGEVGGNTNHPSFIDRNFKQADATLRGFEAELSYNLNEAGWFSRWFADNSRGTLDQLGNLPLQPAMRTGAELGNQAKQWRSSLSIIKTNAHDRFASTETITQGYTRVDASVSYVQRMGTTDLTWFVLARNLLNEEIRLSTSLLKDVLPQPRRNIVLGVRARF